MNEKGLGIYTSSESIRMIFLGFSAGLPHPLLFATLTVWLATLDVSISEISMFGWVGIIYAIKFLWAPMLDNLSIPFLTKALGQRRSWILIMQLIILMGFIWMSFVDPTKNLVLLVYLSILIAFASASQDVAIDAYRIEIIENTHWFKSSVIEPFFEFFKRSGFWSIILITYIAIYRVSDLILGIVANPFYIDIGFNLNEIATVTKVFGFAVTIVGAFVGGISVARYGIPRPLILSSVLLAGTNLFFLLLNNIGPDLSVLVLTISADNFALGFSGSVFIAFLSSLTNRYYTASQYGMFNDIMFVPGI